MPTDLDSFSSSNFLLLLLLLLLLLSSSLPLLLLLFLLLLLLLLLLLHFLLLLLLLIIIIIILRQLTIPKLLDDHRDDFIPRKSRYGPNNPYRDLSNIALARYIAHKLPAEQAEQLSAMVDVCDSNRGKKGHPTRLRVDVMEEETSIGYAFPPVRRLSMLEGSLPPPRPQADSRKKSCGGRTYQKIKPYSFTEDTMSFVKNQSQLLASLVSLLCPPEGSPSRQQLDLPTMDGKILAETDELEREGEKEKDAEGGKMMAFTQSQHPHRSKPPQLWRSSSLTEVEKGATVLARPSRAWMGTFTSLMAHFDDETPLKEFLTSRLSAFEGIIPWDRLVQEAVVDGEGGPFSQDPVICLRKLAVLPCRSTELSHSCSLVVRKLLKRGMSDAVLRFQKTEPVANNGEQVQFAMDLCLTSTFTQLVAEEEKEERATSSKPEFNPLTLLYQLSDSELAARLTLSSLEVWPVGTCVDLLMLCFYHLPPSSSFSLLVGHHLDRLQTYLKIMETIDNPLSPVEAQGGPWSHWAALAADTREKPFYVLGILLEAKAFSLARDWARVHELGEDITKVTLLHAQFTSGYSCACQFMPGYLYMPGYLCKSSVYSCVCQDTCASYQYILVHVSTLLSILVIMLLFCQQIDEDYIYELLEGQENPDPYTAQGALEDLPSNFLKMQVREQSLAYLHSPLPLPPLPPPPSPLLSPPPPPPLLLPAGV